MKTLSRVMVVLAAVVTGFVTLGSGAAWAQAVPVGPSVQQDVGPTRWPAAAFDNQNGVFLVVWGPGTIRGIFVDSSGAALGPAFQISDTGVYAQTPRVAFSPDTASFLVVWQSSDGVTTDANGTRVRGRMVSFTSGVSAATQPYSNGTYSTFWERPPVVAYSTASQHFLVAYDMGAATVSPEIHAQLVDTAGSPVGAEIAVTESPSEYDREPAVGYFPSTDRFVVVWSGNGSSADFIRARLYNASDGSPVGSVATVTNTSIAYVPDVALNSGTGEMFVTWIQADAATSAWRPYGAFLDDSGAVLTTPARLSATVGSYDANSVAYNIPAQTFFLVTHGNTVQDAGFEINGDGTPVAEATDVTSTIVSPTGGSFNPRIAASSLEPRWILATAADFASLWTQLIVGTDTGGGGGTVSPRLTISPVPTGGTVTGGGLTCGTGGTTCQVTFASATSVTLTATPVAGFGFIRWGGSCSGTSTTTTVEVTSLKTCSATFAAVWLGPSTEPAGCAAAPTVVWASTPGPIGTSVNQYAGSTQYPDVAYDRCHQVYLTVWSLGGTIRGRFIGEDGAGVGNTFYVSSGQYAQTPKVTYDPNIGNFLVAWHSSASDSRTEVRSALVTYPAGPAVAGTVLSAATYSTRWTTRPGIGYGRGAGRYFVSWSKYAAPDGADLSARLVDTLGEPAGSEFDVLAGTGDYDRESTVGYFLSTNRFLLAWSTTSTGTDYVRGQMFDAATGAAYGSSLVIGQSPNIYVPEAALNTASDRMFVVWIQPDAESGGWRPFGRFLDGSGALVTTAARLSATAGAYDANSIDYNPLSGTFYLVTHGSTAQDVGFEIRGDGVPLSEAVLVTSITPTGLTGAFNPRLAASQRQPRWLVATAASFTSMWTQLVGGTPPASLYQLTVTTPTGGTVTGGGISCGASGTGTCSVTFTGSTSVTLTAAPASGYSFTSWGGSCSGTSTTTTVTVDSPKTCTATFTALPTYSLLISPTPTGGTVTGGGISCGTSGTGTCSVTYTTSTSVTLTAAPASGYTFTSWGGSCSGTSTTTTVTVNSAKTCSATFTSTTAPTYQLTVTTPTGGTVTGGGISCGTSGTGTCSVTYAASTSVTLTAAPESSYSFTSWGGSCSGTSTTTTVTVDGVKSCTATFTAGLPTGPPYTMTISPVPTGGIVTGAGVACGTGGSLCSATMPASMPYGLQATPDAGYTFTGWTGNCSGTNPSLYILLSGARTCGATFTSTSTPTYRLTVTTPTGGTVTGGGISCGTSGTGTCSVTYTASTPVTLTAAPASGYTFTSWGGNCSGTSTTTSVTVDSAKTCTATFTATPTYSLTVTTPTGGTVTGGGISCGTSGTGTCSVTYTTSTPVTLTAAPASGYTFVSWGGSCSGTSTTATVTVDSAKTCTATFSAGLPTITISPVPTGGTVTGAGLACGTGGSVCAYTAPASMPYGLQATPDAGYTFTGWTGSCSGTSASIYILLSGAQTCGATFTSTSTPTYRLTVTTPTGGTVTGGGISCGTSGTGTCSVTYTTSTPVTLTAAPASGYRFTSWGGSCSGTSTTTSVTVDSAKTCTATFTALPTYSLSISPTPTGGTVTGGGISCGTSGTGTCSVTYTASTPVTLTAAPASGYTFVSWGGSCSGTSTTANVTVDSAKTCTATFSAGLPTITISPVPTGGTVTGAGLACGTGGSVCAYTAPASMPYGLQATPDAGYTFTGWTGSCSGTSASIYILLSGAQTCGATFTSTSTPTYRLTVTTPTGGTVTGGGISCGTSGTGTCSVTYTTSTPVTLTAAPASGYRFTSWGGSCSGTSTTTSVTVDSAKTCTATFTALPTYSLSISPTPTGGTVTGGGISCGTSGTGTCSVTYTTSTPVTLTAAPASGYTFVSWGGSCSGTSTTTSVTVDSAKTCTATFSAGLPTITISPVPTGGIVTGAGLACGTGGSVCAYTAPASMAYGLQATPATGYTFTGWTGNCSGTNPSLYILLNGAQTCGATFTPIGTGQ